MNDSQLNSLIGLDLTETCRIIRLHSLEPRIYHEQAIKCFIGLPQNVVEINHDDNNKIVSAYTQVSIDAKYNKKKSC